MEVEIIQIPAHEWRARFSENAHKGVFGEHLSPGDERIDFALLAVLPEETQMLGYVTCKEVDRHTLHWVYGGSFDFQRGSIYNYRAYLQMLAHCGTTYKRMTTLIENSNEAMLKMAAKAGLKIIGVRNYTGQVFLEHGLEWAHD